MAKKAVEKIGPRIEGKSWRKTDRKIEQTRKRKKKNGGKVSEKSALEGPRIFLKGLREIQNVFKVLK